ncbi:MAG: acyl--CoA ligase [Verrucomicrobia bacterium]|nr:acyl--CoA ligase [Verrucomicrobiota bacterium]
MSGSSDLNFADRVLRRLSPNSQLVDAPSGQAISAAEIRDSVTSAAAAFLSAGLQAGEPVLISCGLNPASTLAYLGAMYAGLVPVPLEDRSIETIGESLASKTRSKAVWTEKAGQCTWAKQAGLPHFVGRFESRYNCLRVPAGRAETDLAALMPTSGSTGVPRLVRVTHGNLLANTEAIVRSQVLGADERAMLILPLNYCFGASVIHSHLYQGGSVVFDPRFMFPDKVLRAIDTYGCTTFAGVPTVYNILIGRSSIRSISMPGLRRFLQAGGPLASKSIQTMREIVPHAEFFTMYGQTEATSRISCLSPARLTEKLGSAGLALDNLILRIADEAGEELPEGQIGEVWVKGPSICDGYFEDPEETEHKFSGGWLKTGDLGALDQDGYLWIKGRKGDFMKIRGVRVSFAEVEAKVAATPGVYECAAASIPHPEAGEALALFIVAEKGASDLSERVRRAIPPQWTCGAVNLVADLPKTANGKIARYLLKTMV